MKLDLTKVEKLIQLAKEYELSELAVSDDDHKVSIKRGGVQPMAHAPVVAPTAVAAAPAASSSSVAATGTSSEGSTIGANEDLVRSPFVGTFYRSASPGSDPFIEVGQKVTKGATLCIVEAMKLMNEIEAETSGTIKEILVDNEQPVEFDQPLFVIEK